jgi:hypothetical protein
MQNSEAGLQEDASCIDAPALTETVIGNNSLLDMAAPKRKRIRSRRRKQAMVGTALNIDEADMKDADDSS